MDIGTEELSHLEVVGTLARMHLKPIKSDRDAAHADPGNHVERELEEEFKFHIEDRIELEIARGLSPEKARFAALRAIDGVGQRKEECRDTRRVNYIDDLLRDLRYAGRNLRQTAPSAELFST